MKEMLVRTREEGDRERGSCALNGHFIRYPVGLIEWPVKVYGQLFQNKNTNNKAYKKELAILIHFY